MLTKHAKVCAVAEPNDVRILMYMISFVCPLSLENPFGLSLKSSAV